MSDSENTRAPASAQERRDGSSRQEARRPGDRRRRRFAARHAKEEEILNVRVEAESRWSALERFIAHVARLLAHPLFFATEIVFHVVWLVANSGVVPGVRPWDPYPFSLLMGIASVQALFIGLLILMYEERSTHVGELREETELQVALHGERETTKLVRMMMDVHRHLGIESRDHDDELSEMMEPLDPRRLRDELEEDLDELEE